MESNEIQDVLILTGSHGHARLTFLALSLHPNPPIELASKHTLPFTVITSRPRPQSEVMVFLNRSHTRGHAVPIGCLPPGSQLSPARQKSSDTEIMQP